MTGGESDRLLPRSGILLEIASCKSEVISGRFLRAASLSAFAFDLPKLIIILKHGGWSRFDQDFDFLPKIQSFFLFEFLSVKI